MQAPITLQHVLEQSAPHKRLWLQFILIPLEFQVNCPPVEGVKGLKAKAQWLDSHTHFTSTCKAD
jgi:hypothetical protein